MRGSMPNYTSSWLNSLLEAMQGSRSVPCHSAVSDAFWCCRRGMPGDQRGCFKDRCCCSGKDT